MKKTLLIIAAVIMVAFTSCKEEGAKFVATDYSNPENWMVCEANPQHEVDVFYLYPTSASPQCQTLVSPIDDAMKFRAYGNYLKGAEGFSAFANMYAPYYRQISGVGILQCKTPDELTKMCYDNEPYVDVYAALDYYFENINNGRPFVFASHSQGTAMMKNVLSDYMKKHPEYMKRMVAAYAVGFNFSQEWLDANGLKFAEGETDTGVVVSWNVEGPGATMDNLPIMGGTISINPLNWKRDATPATVEENLGSVLVNAEINERQFVPGIADATVDPNRGVVVVTSTTDYIPTNPVFGDKSFHMDEWTFYFQNAKENCKKRIEAYLGHEVEDYSSQSSWVNNLNEINPDFADVVWFTGTMFQEEKDENGKDLHHIFLTDAQKAHYAEITLMTKEMMYHDSLNFFAPFYHQFTLDLIDCPAEYMDSIYNVVADEAYAKFHYYMENMNNGRPYILAGMSQGGMMVRGVLKRMTDEEYSKMKAAYSLGFGLSEEDLQCKHIVPAEGQYDKGVTVSFNSVADVDGIWPLVRNNAVTCMNPVNWKTDSTPAEFEFNGMKLTAHIDPAYNLIFVDNFDFSKYPSVPGFDKYDWFKTNLHIFDIPLYAPFLRQNTLDRAYR